jgi:hypothetical protein
MDLKPHSHTTNVMRQLRFSNAVQIRSTYIKLWIVGQGKNFLSNSTFARSKFECEFCSRLGISIPPWAGKTGEFFEARISASHMEY